MIMCDVSFFLNLKFSNSTTFGNIQHIQYDRGHEQEAHTFTDTYTLGSQMNATDCSILRLYTWCIKKNMSAELL